MKRAALVATMLACAFTLALAGCSGGATKADEETVKGFWALEDQSLGFTAGLSLEEGNVAELLIADSFFEGNWAIEGSDVKLTLEDSSATPVSAHLNGDKLVLGSDQGSHLVFVRGNEDEFYEAYDAQTDELSSVDAAELGLSDSVEIVEEKIDSIEPVSIADDSTVKIEVTGKGTDFTADPGYRLSITNKTKEPFFLAAEGNFKVNGKEIETGLGDSIDAGATVETFLYFSKVDLGGRVEALKDVEGKITIIDDATDKELGSYTFKMD